MEQLRTIIIDDEEKSRRVLKNLLNKFCPEVIIIAEAEDIEEGYELINTLKPDLLLLDIQMPSGNGFKLLKQFDNLFFDVIFITGYDQYAINAIKFSALDYLLKPVEVNDLKEAIKKAIVNKKNKANKSINILNLLNTQDSENIKKKIIVHQNEKVLLLEIESIILIEADDRYSHIKTDNGELHTISKTLKEFEDYFEKNPAFIRINKNYLININFIKKYSKGEPCIVELQNGDSFEISRRKKQEFLERLKNKI